MQTCQVAILIFQGNYNKSLSDVVAIQRDKGVLHTIFKVESTKFDN